MRKTIVSIIIAIFVSAIIMTACADTQSADLDPSKTDSTGTTKGIAVPNSGYDPYAIENRYDIGEEMFEKHDGVDYGTLVKDVSYYSTVAGDNKQVNILLPAGYDENQTYPVTYVFHGFGGDHNTHIDTDSYLVLLYGNMLHDELAVPQILVGMDMYTDILADKDSKTDEELRYIYDKAVKETGVDLMPFIEENYSVKTGRENTAVAGMSEGGAKSLCTGFEWLDKFGYIGAFAPDTNVIPIGENYMDSFWTVPYFPDGFPQPTDDTTPYYLYMPIGSEDPWNIEGTLYYRDMLDEMGVRNQTDLVDGYGHDADFWGQCFYNYLSKIFRQ